MNKSRRFNQSQAAHKRLAARHDRYKDDHHVILGAYHRLSIKRQSSLGRLLTEEEKRRLMRSVESSWYD